MTPRSLIFPLVLAWLLAGCSAPEAPADEHGHGDEHAAAEIEKGPHNGRMLRTFVQIMRSGEVGRTSLGTRPKRLVQRWLEEASMPQLMAAATGNAPSLADIVRMIDLGVDGIISDYPDRVRESLAKRGLALPPRY